MPFEDDPLAFYGRNIIEDYHARLKARLPLEAGWQSDSVDVFDDQPRFLPEKKVGILGAGIGGLYTALILDSLDIEYEILEASDRTGGRMCTYRFPGGDKYDYYNTGAMRFPFPKKDSQGQYKNGVMKRLAELTEYGPLNEGQDCLRGSLVPFYYQARDGSKPGYYYFNGIREPVSSTPKRPFGAQEMDVDASYIRAGVDAIISDVTQSFVRMLVRDIETGTRKGWEVLMANDSSYSVRTYMATKYLPSAHLAVPPQHLPTNVINWCGLLGRRIDNALVETVFTLLKHTNIGSTDYGDVQWKCFGGGSETLPKRIEEYLNKKGSFIRFDERVTAISQGFIDLGVDEDKIIDELSGPGTEAGRRINIASVTVTVNGNERRTYSHVISTLPLPVLRTVDLHGAGLNVMQRNPLRALPYRTATKIAILFKSNWWTTKLGIYTIQSAHCQLFLGCTRGPPWFSCHSETPRGAEGALAEAHSGLHPDVTYEYLQEEFVDIHVKDWNREECAMGAYASFGPGDFQNLYVSLTYPAARKRLHFAGETVSMHRGWVVGALDSSWRAVYEYLKVTGQVEKIKKFKTLWGENSEWNTKSFLLETA